MEAERGPADTDASEVTWPRHDGDVAAAYCATLIDEWTRRGLTDAVVCPGSRSTPLALALAAAEGVAVHVHHDERSGAFTALGLARATRRPVAVVCTSGTAAVELHPAVVEAHQGFVPLLVLTADRPPELHGVGAPQTIDQRDLYGRSVRWFCEPGPPDLGGAPWWRDLARDAWNRAVEARPGPVHLNLAFREPLVGEPAPPGMLHAERPGGIAPEPDQAASEPQQRAPWGLTDEALAGVGPLLSGRRVLLVAGERAAGSDDDARRWLHLATTLGWPVLADHLSGLRRPVPCVVTTYDPLVCHEPAATELRPDAVIRLGGRVSSKVLGSWLASSGAVQLGIDVYGDVPDPERVVAERFHVDPAIVAEQLDDAGLEPAPGEWTEAWRGAEAAARPALERVVTTHTEATEPGVAIDVATLLSDGGQLVVSSSMPVRDLEWYGPARWNLTVMANRGANGIDGVVSTAVGAALTGEPTVLLVGDVAFLHDTNGLLGLVDRHVNLTIVVVHNDGGGIFSFLPQRDQLGGDMFEMLFGTPHGVDLVALCAAHRIPAEEVTSRTGAQAAIVGALTRGGARVVVVRTDRDDNVALHREMHAAVAAAWDRRHAS